MLVCVKVGLCFIPGRGHAQEGMNKRKPKAAPSSPILECACVIRAEALGRHVSATGTKPELVVVSPMRRALQTASGRPALIV